MQVTRSGNAVVNILSVLECNVCMFFTSAFLPLLLLLLLLSIHYGVFSV